MIKSNKDGSFVFSIKSTAVISIAAMVTAIVTMYFTCNKFVESAKCNIIEPVSIAVAESIFVDMHKPFESKICKIDKNILVIKTILEHAFPDSIICAAARDTISVWDVK